jgi:RNA polymerase sigma-70 factor (ECF subfamily)
MMVRAMTREIESQTDPRDDAELIAAIARQRDQSAIAELLRRYQSEAYALALRLVGNRESAEDVVQEVMLRVWKTAPSYRGEGPVRAWLLRIVARESLNTIKKLKRVSVRMKTDWAERQDDGPNAESKIESTELAGALRHEYERLPELDRQLIGLHYGGGLTQQEISEALSIPQQTISNHLNRTLKSLRSALSVAGYAALPIAIAEGIGDALRSGAEPPTGLQHSVLAKIAANKSIRSNRESVRKAQSRSWVLPAGAATVMACGALIWLLSRGTAQKMSPAASATPPPISPAEVPYDWHRHWTFEHGIPAEFLIDKPESWKWNHEKNTLDVAGSAEFAFNHRMPGEPLVITMKCRFIDLSRKFFFGERLIVRDAPKNAELNERNKGNFDHTISSAELDRKLYIYKNKFVTVINGKIWSATDLERSAADAILLMAVENVSIEEVDVAPLKENEVPDFIKDPKTYQY